MIIDQDSCIGCEECLCTCPVNAIQMENDCAFIEEESCVECGNCLRVADCPVEAISQDELGWPRIIRKCFSDNHFQWPQKLRYSLGYGRGTEECKTNDRTGKFKKGDVGLIVELGRPSTGAYLSDAEKVAKALIASGASMASDTPFTGLLKDPANATLPDDLRVQKVLSCIVEGLVPLSNLKASLQALRRVSQEIDTVFSLGLITRVNEGFELPIKDTVNVAGFKMEAACKVNVGLGKPLCLE